MIIHNPILTGSFTVNGVDVLGITGSAANLAALNTFTASAATTGSNNFVGNQVVSGSLTVTGSIITPGTLTAQTLVVQTITSSVDFVTGSTRFGSLNSNTHVFTGSMNLTGSLTVTTTGTELQVNANGVNLGNALTDSHVISGSLTVNPNGLFVSSSGRVGIGTFTPTVNGAGGLQVFGSSQRTIRITGNSNNANSLEIGCDTTKFAFIQSVGAADRGIQFYTGDASVISMTLTGSSIGIGTITPTSGKLEIQTGATSAALWVQTGGTTSAFTIADFRTGTNLSALQIFGDGSSTFGGRVRIGSFTSIENSGGVDTNLSNNATFDGTNWKYIASQEAARYLMNRNTHQFFIASAGTAGNNITFTQAMNINSGGNVLIGIDRVFGINTSDGSDNGYLALCGAGGDGEARGGHIYLSGNERAADAGSVVLSAGNVAGTGTINFRTGAGVERMRITQNGYLKIAPNGSYIAPTTTFHELHSTAQSSDLLYARHTQTDPYGIEIVWSGASPNNTTNWWLYCADTTNPKAIIYSNGTFGSRTGTYGSIISDEKYKTEIESAKSQWDDIKNLRVVNFKFKQDVELEGENALRQIGFIAQEVEQVSPNLVYESTDRDSGETWKSVKTSIIEIKAIKALQEAITRIEQLEAEIDELKNK